MEDIVRRLEATGHAGRVARIHGGMDYKDRETQIDAFRGDCRFMVATDAAGEGINLQFCWIMVNYDIPWNPARIEQRFGRIHRYKQKHDPVVLVNLVANDTREGKVLATLLNKLEAIRKEMRSDKVFDVIGRQFSNVSLAEIIINAVMGDEDTAAAALGSMLTVEQAKALEKADARLRGTGGDVAAVLPTIQEQKSRDDLYRLLPGYVSSFVATSAPRMGISINGDLDGRFTLSRLPVALALALEQSTEGKPVPMTVTKPAPDEEALFLRPGEPFFERYRAYICDGAVRAAAQGSAFADPEATEPYLYHLALVSTIRRGDPTFPDDFPREETLDVRLVALAQPLV